MKYVVDTSHFEKGNSEYLDIQVHHHPESYIEIQTPDDTWFSIESNREIDDLCKKLKELLRAAKASNVVPTKPVATKKSKS